MRHLKEKDFDMKNLKQSIGHGKSLKSKEGKCIDMSIDDKDRVVFSVGKTKMTLSEDQIQKAIARQEDMHNITPENVMDHMHFLERNQSNPFEAIPGGIVFTRRNGRKK